MNTTARTIRFYASAIASLAIYLTLALYLTTTPALAVPSFARQTGIACGACHTVFPELTSFGRTFKLNGYTLTGLKQIEASGAAGSLKINQIPPLSVMINTGVTNVSKDVPGEQNNNVEFPQELSLFYAGEISPNMGAFVQLTYSQPDDKFGFDLADFRYANRTTVGGNDLAYGVSLNNAAGMEDLWHTTPVWGYPFTGSDTAPGPAADLAINDFTNAAGLGGYALLNNHWYGAVTFYRSAPLGQGAAPTNGSIDNVAPYWRFAWQGDLPNDAYLEVGTYGLHAAFTQGMSGAGAVGQSDKYTDWAADVTYQQPVGDNRLITTHAVYIHEDQTLDSSFANGLSSNRDNTLQQFRINGNYEFGHAGQVSLGYFNTWGSNDKILYATAPGDIDNSISGSPNSGGFIAEVDWLPWENTKFSVQYTAYTKFNGGGSDYNGGGRSASDNNTLYLNAWFLW